MSVDLVARALGAKAGRSANTAALIAGIREYGNATRATERLPANDLPTLTLSANGAASTINGNAWYAPTVNFRSELLTYLCGPIVDAGAAHPTWNYMRARGAYFGPGSRGLGSPIAYEFIHKGTQLEIPLFGQGSSGINFRLLVNGALAGTMAVPNSTGQAYYLKAVFPASGTRRITVETNGVPANGVNVANASVEIASTGRTPPLVTMIGDSLAEGTGAAAGEGQSLVLARALGFDCGLAAAGGTGMINPGSRVPFTDPDRLVDLTLAGVTSTQNGSAPASPRMGIVFGSFNDQGASPTLYGPYGATLQDAIANRTHAMIDAWVAARPGRPLVFFGPTWPSGPPNNRPPLTVYAIRDGIMEAAWSRASENVWFIDRLMPFLREGVYSTTSDQASLYTGSDSTHPTTMGHKFDGLWMAAALRRLILSEFV